MKFHLFFALGIALCSFLAQSLFVLMERNKTSALMRIAQIPPFMYGEALCSGNPPRCGHGSGEQLAAVRNPAHGRMSFLQQMEANFISVVFAMKTLVPTPALLKMKWEWMRTYLHFS